VPRVALVSSDPDLQKRLAAALDRDAALDRLEPTRPLAGQLSGEVPSLLLVDIGPDAAAAGLVRQAVDLAFGLIGRPEVVTLGRAGDAEQVLQAMRAGSVDFIDRGEPARALRDHIGPRLRQANAANRGDHALSVVIGADAGIVATLFAVNLALIRAAAAGDALLIDCALPATQADAALNLTPAYAIPDAIRDRDRLDRTLLGAAVATHAAGVSLLPLATRSSEDAAVSPDGFLRTLRVLRPLYGETVLVMGGLRHPAMLRAAVEMAANIYLVCPQAFTAVREAKDTLAAIGNEPDLAARVTLVVEEYSPTVTLSDDQMRDALGVKRSFKLPRARDDLLNSLNLGQPLVVERPQGAYADALRRLSSGGEGEAVASQAGRLSTVKGWLGGIGAKR
jgi:pilus assembly protein CpaE